MQPRNLWMQALPVRRPVSSLCYNSKSESSRLEISTTRNANKHVDSTKMRGALVCSVVLYDVLQFAQSADGVRGASITRYGPHLGCRFQARPTIESKWLSRLFIDYSLCSIQSEIDEHAIACRNRLRKCQNRIWFVSVPSRRRECRPATKVPYLKVGFAPICNAVLDDRIRCFLASDNRAACFEY